MAFVGQAFKADTLASQMTAGATSGTLAAGNFANFTTDYLVLDYDNPTSREIILCNVTGTAISSATRGISPTSDVTHAAGAAVAYVFLPNHYVNGLGVIAEGDALATWVPTYTPFTTMTFTSVTTTYAKYRQIDRRVYFAVQATGTIGGTPTNQITVTFPVTAASGLGNWPFNGTVDQGALVVGMACYASTTGFIIRKGDASNYAAGVLNLTASGWYEAAAAGGA